MARKPEKTPAERGLTASTDLRIVRREIGKYSEPSPLALTNGMYYKEIFDVTANIPAPAPAPAPAAPAAPQLIPRNAQAAPSPYQGLTISVGSISAGSIAAAPRSRIEEIHYELILQQRWYGPYGDPEWHDMPFVDNIPQERRPA